MIKINFILLLLVIIILSASFISFVFLPQGWNVIPLGFGLVLASLLLKKIFPKKNKTEKNKNSTENSAELPPEQSDIHCTKKTKTKNLLIRLHRALAPVAAGAIIDIVDLATFGPIGLYLGFPLGAIAGIWMGYALGLKRKFIVLLSLASGIYCMIPGTNFIPLGTIVGAILRFFESDKNNKDSKK